MRFGEVNVTISLGVEDQPIELAQNGGQSLKIPMVRGFIEPPKPTGYEHFAGPNLVKHFPRAVECPLLDIIDHDRIGRKIL
jgi:hypothetical protein